MQLLFFFLFSFFSQAYALDTGDGSDMDCNWNGFTITDSVYNCQTLNITGLVTVDPAVTDVVFIKVQGDVLIDATLDLSGKATGQGPGGYQGGSGGSPTLPINGSDGSAPTFAINARGRGGGGSLQTALEECRGAGGSGGRHAIASTVLAATGITNPVGCDPQNINGGGPPSSGYGNVTNFHNNITGGSGGGGGGAADTGTQSESGGRGGNGGGALKIYAGGNITLDANAYINLKGENGTSTTTVAGAGGGGAGGAVLLAALGDMEFLGDGNPLPAIDVAGGEGGTAPGGATNGTRGGDGLIRLEDSDGLIPGQDVAVPGASVGLNPTAAATNSSVDAIQMQSDISAGCAISEHHSYKEFNSFITIFFLFIFGIGIGISKINKASSTRCAD